MNVILFYLNLLLFLSLILGGYYFIISKNIMKFLRQYSLIVISILVLSIIYKLPYDLNFFLGLEYEDSYLANSVSRFLMYNRSNSNASFLANTCGIGSLTNCNASFTHSGNLIGLPSIVWVINEIFGYNLNNISFVNFLFSVLSGLSIFFIGYKINRSYLFGFISSIVFITTPIFNSFHTSSLFETSASSLITLSLLLFILYFEKSNNEKNRFVLFLLLVIINLLSIHFKRENIIIISFPFILLFIKFLKYKWDLKKHIVDLLPYLAFLVGLLFYYFNTLDITRSLHVEQDYAIGNSFQFKFFPSLIMMFFNGFSNFSWFYVFGLFTLLGIVYIALDFRKKPNLLYPLIIFLSFIILNTLHHRSYYFVRSGQVTGFESLRHMNMLSPFFSLITGYGIYKLILLAENLNFLKKKFKIILLVLGIPILIHLLILTINVRNEMIRKEQNDRIEPVSFLLNSIDVQKDVILTDQSILFHNYCDPDLLIIDFTTLGVYVQENDLENLLRNYKIHFLWKDYFEEDVFHNRYKNSFKVLENFDLSNSRNGNGFKIIDLKTIPK